MTNNNLTNPNETFSLSPEALAFTDVYLNTLDINETAKELEIPVEDATKFLAKKEVKRFIDTIFLEQGYMNKFALKGLLETAIKSKLEEAEETGVYTNKDLLDIVKLMHDMRKDELKLLEAQQAIGQQTNVQVNSYGDNLSSLISQLVNPT